jgi:hypothetical protein
MTNASIQHLFNVVISTAMGIMFATLFDLSKFETLVVILLQVIALGLVDVCHAIESRH